MGQKKVGIRERNVKGGQGERRILRRGEKKRI